MHSPLPPAFASQISVSDFQYPLPTDRIAQHPLAQREAARLLHWRGGQLAHRQFVQLGQLLPPGALLVRNTTQVVPARVVVRRQTGARVEVLCLQPLAPHTEVASAMQQTGWAEWLCYVGNAKKWKADEVLTLANEDNPFWLRLHNLGRQGDGFRIRLEWEPQALAFVDVLKQAGEIPLPPYLNRPAQAADTHRYQTVFAQQPGAVAAPTASLHFTESVCSNLEANGFGFADVTLHVGAGTFKPVEAATAHCHTMHHEECGISLAQLQRLAQHTGPVVPIGTTAMRTLESLYWHALAVAQGTAEPQRLQVAQWEPYAPDGMRQPLPPASQLLAALATALQANGHSQVMGHTGLMIVPGYRPQVCHALLTNFHQPGSTLLMLVAALVGPDWKAIYDSALAEGYRFLSYGDASLLEW